VGLTSFGALFMILGVIMLFDGALIALGNVRLSFPLSLFLRVSGGTDERIVVRVYRSFSCADCH
jgi:hypothetical protein